MSRDPTTRSDVILSQIQTAARRQRQELGQEILRMGPAEWLPLIMSNLHAAKPVAGGGDIAGLRAKLIEVAAWTVLAIDACRPQEGSR